MNCKFNYRKVDASESLESYTLEHLEGVARFLLKEGRWTVEISKSKNMPRIQIKVSSPWGFFTAEGKSHDFYSAVDLASQRLVTQIKKRKNQLQYHKKPHKSRTGHLERLNSSLEYFPENYPFPKVS
jgi:ribosomal subunit interface protein